MNYSIQLWAELVSDFTKEFVDQPYVLVGNSIGSLVSLQAATLRRNAGDSPQPCGLVLINCAGATLRSWGGRPVVLKVDSLCASSFCMLLSSDQACARSSKWYHSCCSKVS